MGLYETLFNTNYQYYYRLGEELRHSDKKIDALFVRKENLRRLLEKGKSKRKGEISIATKFENNALINYIEKVYFPVKDYQDHQVSLE